MDNMSTRLQVSRELDICKTVQQLYSQNAVKSQTTQANFTQEIFQTNLVSE